MAKPRTIVIEIPQPCHQDWGQMQPVAQGRFCGHCQETVIDFTRWSDKQLFDFFAGNNKPVCGRYLATQLGRHISLPPQPHSRLYRIVAAMGLALVFTHATEVKVHARQPMAFQLPVGLGPEGGDTARAGQGGIRGIVLDNKHEPLINASVRLMQGGILICGTITDFEGNYEMKGIKPGNYDVTISYTGFRTSTVTGVPVADTGAATVLTANMVPDNSSYRNMQIVAGRRRPLSDPFVPDRVIIDRQRIKNMGY